MSIQSNTFDVSGAIETSGRAGKPGFWSRFFAKMIAAQEARAKREIAHYIAGLSEQQRKDRGLTATGQLR